jgi:hypothetical protein
MSRLSVEGWALQIEVRYRLIVAPEALVPYTV